jgi:dephospho-CoA kinase
MRIIGVVGQNGSGKDEVLKHLRLKYDVPFLSTGDAVREIAKKEGIEPTRENLKAISEKCFREMGEGCFVKLVADKIQSQGWQAAGISGIRSINDVKILRGRFGKDFILIDVYVSDSHQRYERMVKRGEQRDPLSYEQFTKQDKAEEALFHIEDAEKQANYHISNDGALADLHRAIDKLVSDKGLIGPSSRNSRSDVKKS